MPAFDTQAIEKMLQGLKGMGNDSKDKFKNDKKLKELEGKIQKQLAEQQAQYAQQLQAQESAARLQMQREEQSWRSPFEMADRFGNLNGQSTLEARDLQQKWTMDQQKFGEDTRQFNTQFGEEQRQFDTEFGENRRQFDTTFGEERRQFDTQIELDRQGLALESEIERGQLELSRLTQQQNNAIEQGRLDLSREIEGRRVALEERQLTLQNELQQAELSGYLPNGQLTEQARAQRMQEVMERTGMMGVDEQGRLTDASQQWRTNAALEAARTNAQLGMQSKDYFEAAAYNRDPNVQGTLAFLNNPAAQGSSMGFRSAAVGTPGVNSIQNLQGGPAMNPALEQAYQTQAMKVANPQQNVPGNTGFVGPSPSLGAAQAAASGQPAAFTTAMHTDAPAQPTVMGSMKAYNQNATMQPKDAAQLRLEQIQRQVIQPGAHRLAPGTMEAWSPTERGLMQSALKASGVNPEDFEQQYQRSKLQTNASARMM